MRISVSAKQLVMPSVCACCGGSSNTTVPLVATRVEGKRVIRTKTSAWNVPFCARCAAHDREWPSVSGFAVLILVVLTLGLYLYFYIQRRQRALAMCMASCARPQQSIHYLGWHGTVHRFDFTSEVFARAFLESNAKKVVELDASARRLLETPATTTPPRIETPPLRRGPEPAARRNTPPPVLRTPTPVPAHIASAPTAPSAVHPAETFCGPEAVLSIAGRELHGPLVYVARGGSHEDASTIVPSLQVGRALAADPLPYWPGYSKANPNQRAAYLDWLAADRSDPKIAQGYIFIYFYGLERRLLVDRMDHDIVRSELKRLLSIYGQEYASFRSCAGNLMAFTVLHGLEQASEFTVYAQLADLAEENETALAGLLAWFHRHERPLPVRFAMTVASKMEGAKHGVAVTRARAELEELFSIRYRERFADGIRVDAAQRSMTVQYKVAGTSFLATSSRQLSLSIPNVLGKPSQFKPLVALWNDCLADLKKLSFARRDRADAPLTADAWMSLPPELRDDYDHPDQDKWDVSFLGSEVVGAFRMMSAGMLANLAGLAHDERVTAVKLRRAVETAAMLGYAVEPDARVANNSMAASAKLAVWRTEATQPPDARVWKSIHTILTLTLAVAAADGEIADEEAHTVHVVIEELFQLDDATRMRVAALRSILTRQPARATAIAKRLKETRSAVDLVKIGRLLVAVAAVDGVVVDGEHKVLRSLYKAMGLAASDLSAAIVASGARLESDTPTSVRAATPNAKGEAIPRPRSNSAGLDRPAIAAILAETREVAMLLAEVLDDEDDEFAETSIAPVVASTIAVQSQNGAWSALDTRYHIVVRELLTRPTWSVGEVRTIATRSKLMPGAILEAVNTWSEERFGGQIIEEAGDWLIHADILEGQTA